MLINNKSEIDAMDLKSMDSIVENYKKLENERIKTLLSAIQRNNEKKKKMLIYLVLKI